jgi:hypothetical protein
MDPKLLWYTIAHPSLAWEEEFFVLEKIVIYNDCRWRPPLGCRWPRRRPMPSMSASGWRPPALVSPAVFITAAAVCGGGSKAIRLLPRSVPSLLLALWPPASCRRWRRSGLLPTVGMLHRVLAPLAEALLRRLVTVSRRRSRNAPLPAALRSPVSVDRRLSRAVHQPPTHSRLVINFLKLYLSCFSCV